MNNDILIKTFLQNNRKEIPDNGFSNRVMQNLPNKAKKFSFTWNIMTFVIIGFISFFIGFFEELMAGIYLLTYNFLEYLSTPLILVSFSACVAIVIIFSTLLIFNHKKAEY